jgi:hypothetical protein
VKIFYPTTSVIQLQCEFRAKPEYRKALSKTAMKKLVKFAVNARKGVDSEKEDKKRTPNNTVYIQQALMHSPRNM